MNSLDWSQQRWQDHGATLVEAALVLPFFLLLLVVALDMLRLSYNVLSLQFSANRVLRSSLTAAVDGAVTKAEIQRFAQKFGVSVAGPEISICPFANYPCPGASDAGGPGSLIAVEISVPLDAYVLGFLGRSFVENRRFRVRRLFLVTIEPN